MKHLSEVLNNHPQPQSIGSERIFKVVAALSECALSCKACADACVSEPMVENLRQCITTDLACADVCQTLAGVLTRQTAPQKQVITALARACGVACGACAEECEKHASKHAHCDHCAQICRECERHCDALAAE